ncbi:MAG: nuclear transport factor 2 family protein [Sphingomonadales bacterium]
MTEMIRYVSDRIALMDVMETYVKGVDERDMALYRSTFTDDVRASIGGVTYDGADAWLAFIVAALERFGPTQHMLGPMLAEIDGDTAECRTDLQAVHYLKDRPDTTVTLWATYEQTMRRTADGWKIARHDIIQRGRRTQSD